MITAEKIWNAVREQARAYLEALNPHLRQDYIPNHPDPGVEYIGTGAAYDSCVPEQLRDALLDDSRIDWEGDRHLVAARTTSFLRALRVVADSRSPEEARANTGPLPPYSFLEEEWIMDGRLGELVRRGGPDVELRTEIEDMYRVARAREVEWAIQLCGGGLEIPDVEMSDQEYEHYYAVFCAVVEGHGPDDQVQKEQS